MGELLIMNYLNKRTKNARVRFFVRFMLYKHIHDVKRK